jgi:ferredoxin/coenzyme F420-reducing hydrogenase delta subunit
VISGVAFLREINQGQDLRVEKKVAVIGGGNTAIDSARSALRLGANEVHILYRRSLEEMPAAKEEIEEAVHEGVQMAYLTSPVEVLGEAGKVSALKCIRNELGEPDAGGRRSPTPVAGSEFMLNVDTVIAAIGQGLESSFLSNEPELGEKGNRIVAKDPHTLATSQPGVFAGGDAVTGPATAVAAIAAGKRAAWGIDLYLKEKSEALPESEQDVEPQRISGPVIGKTTKFSRCQNTSLPVSSRLSGFDEVAAVFSEDLATMEALRCLHCHLGAKVNQEKCISCLTCVRVCPLDIPEANKMGEIVIDPVDCQACGMCALECPVGAIEISLHPHHDMVNEMEKAMSDSSHITPKIVSFFDLHGNFGTKDLESLKTDYPNVVPLMVFGLRRIGTYDVLKAFELGADAVLLAACPDKMDPFPETRNKVKGRMAHASAIVEALGLGGNRLETCDMPEKGLIHKTFMDELIKKIKEMGPSPLQV